MQLGDNVGIVEGSRRVALYDVGRRTLVRAPLFVGQLVSEGGLGSATLGAAAARMVEQPKATGYLQEPQQRPWERYHLEATVPQVSPASVLIGAAHRGIPRHVSDALEADAYSRFIRHVIFVASSGASRAPIARLAARHGVSFEIGVEREGRLYSDIYSTRGRLVGRRDPREVASAASLLHIDYGTMAMLRNYVESLGTLYVDADGDVWPHLSERYFVLGNVKPDSLDNVIEGEAHQRHITNHKGVREKCSRCELHLACLRSFVDRIDPNNIASAPSHCHYDPDHESYQNELFA